MNSTRHTGQLSACDVVPVGENGLAALTTIVYKKETLDNCQRLGFDIQQIEQDLIADATRPLSKGQAKRLHSGVQRASRTRLEKAKCFDAEGRLRHRLERWAIPLFPRLRAIRALAVAQRLQKLVPPRVRAAIARTWMNGWCTKRRFQTTGPCLFGCRHGEDAVQHYLACSRLHSHGARQLRLSVPDSPEARRQAALLLDPGANLDDCTLVCRALLLAAAYKLHCTHRRKGFLGSEEDIRRALNQAVKEAARGHLVATRVVDQRWLF